MSEFSSTVLTVYLLSLYRNKTQITRMWADAQRDGHPAAYRWCPLINATKFGWCPLLECCAVMLPRCETHWNLQGCPKLVNRCQPLVGQKFTMLSGQVEQVLLFNTFFFRLSTCLSCEDIARQSCAMVPRWRFFASYIFSEPHAACFRFAS